MQPTLDSIAQRINEHAVRFQDRGSMALLIVESVETIGQVQNESRALLYIFDGMFKCNWSYVNHQFSTDWVGELCLVKPPEYFSISFDDKRQVDHRLRSAFVEHEHEVQPIWQFDPSAINFKIKKYLHENDAAHRVSFKGLAPRGAITPKLIEWWILNGKDPLGVMPKEIADGYRTNMPKLFSTLQGVHERHAKASLIIETKKPSFSCGNCGSPFHERKIRKVSGGNAIFWCPTCRAIVEVNLEDLSIWSFDANGHAHGPTV